MDFGSRLTAGQGVRGRGLPRSAESADRGLTDGPLRTGDMSPVAAVQRKYKVEENIQVV